MALKRGHPLPYTEPKLSYILTALTELELLNERGQVKSWAPGTKLSPFAAPSFLAGLVRRYQLRTFVHAYRHLDDHAFAVSVARLFGTPQPVEQRHETADQRAEPTVGAA